MAIQGKTDIDQLLAKSLKEIAVRRPVEKITIKEITDKAGVIRPTFYNHFQDKFELIEWISMGMTISPREMAEAYQYMLTRSLTDIIKEL